MLGWSSVLPLLAVFPWAAAVSFVASPAALECLAIKTCALSFATAVPVGDTVFVAAEVVWPGTIGTVTATDSGGNTYTQAAAVNFNTSTISATTLLSAITTQMTTVTITTSTTPTNIEIWAVQYHLAKGLDQKATHSGAAPNFSLSVTPLCADEIAVLFVGAAGSATLSTAGFTTRSVFHGNLLADKPVTSLTEITAGGTSTLDWGANLITLRDPSCVTTTSSSTVDTTTTPPSTTTRDTITTQPATTSTTTATTTTSTRHATTTPRATTAASVTSAAGLGASTSTAASQGSVAPGAWIFAVAAIGGVLFIVALVVVIVVLVRRKHALDAIGGAPTGSSAPYALMVEERPYGGGGTHSSDAIAPTYASTNTDVANELIELEKDIYDTQTTRLVY